MIFVFVFSFQFVFGTFNFTTFSVSHIIYSVHCCIFVHDILNKTNKAVYCNNALVYDITEAYNIQANCIRKVSVIGK